MRRHLGIQRLRRNLMIKRFLLPALFLVGASVARADVKLPAIFSDHMVLQQDKPVAIWGWADAGAEVAVSIGDATAKAAPDGSGKWTEKLEQAKAPAKRTALKVKRQDQRTGNDGRIRAGWHCQGRWRGGNARSKRSMRKRPRRITRSSLLRLMRT